MAEYAIEGHASCSAAHLHSIIPSEINEQETVRIYWGEVDR